MSFWATIATVCAACAGPQLYAGAAKPAQQRVTVLQFHAIDKCKNVESPLEFLNYTISRSKLGANVLNAALYNHKALKTFSKIELTINKCADAVSFNTCEYEGTHKFAIGLCQLFASQGVLWGSLLNAVHPPIRCPLPAGPYTLTNGTVDVTDVLKKTGSSFLEKVYGNVYVTESRAFNEKSELHFCVRITYSFHRMRVKP